MTEPQPQQEEKLSGTLAGGIGRLFKALARVPPAMRGISAAIAGAGAVVLVVGIGIYLFSGEMRTFAVVMMGIGALLLLIAAIASTRAVVAAVTGRQGRYGTNTFVMVAAFLGILVVVNFLAFRTTARLDVTATKEFSLAPRSVELLKSLNEPVQAIAFFREGRQEDMLYRSAVDDLLHEFERRSSKFSYRFVDPDVDTVTAQEYGIYQPRTIVFEETTSKRRQSIFVPPVLEQDFVTGLLIATGREQRIVYFLSGHGEPDISDEATDSSGAGLAYGGLLRDNYLGANLNLLEAAEVPKDAAALIIAGPKNDFQESEVQKLDAFLKAGGRIVALVDPDTPQTVRDFLAKWGVTVEQGWVIDLGRNVGGDPKIPLLQRDQYNSQAQELTGILDVTFYPGLASLKPTQDKMDYIQWYPLALTTQYSALVKDPTQTQPSKNDPLGPFYNVMVVKALAPLGETPSSDPAQRKVATLVVFGDSDFITNKYFYAFSNGDFFLNSVNWITGDFSLISIRPKPTAFRQLVLTSTDRQFIRYSTWLLLPLAMLGVATLAWWRRR